MTARTAPSGSHGVEELLGSVPHGETPDLSGGYPRLEEARIRSL
jgi:thioredoxin reductase (NADPH)